MGPVIAVRGFSKYYDGTPAVNAVSFDITAGEIVGFVGLNGAGKSTTINAILGFLRTTKGEIELFGQSVTPETAHKTHARIGFASGDMNLFDNLSGNQYFDFVLHRAGVRDRSRLDELCARFKPQADKKIGDLSRGNKQKIALIAAFMTRPQLVILDEPSSGLDPLMQQVFIELVREEAARGTTIFMSSHYLNEVTDVCSRILLIKQGVLVKDLQTEQLINRGGKLIRVVSKGTLELPPKADVLHERAHGKSREVAFVFHGTVPKLQAWLAHQSGVLDFEVKDHDEEAAFEDLYKLEVSDDA